MTRSGRFFCLILLLVLVGGLLAGASRAGYLAPSDPRALSVMSWNCQNLFDDQFQGSEYSEYVPGAAQGEWRTPLYEERLRRAARVILGVFPGGADVVMLQEVENRQVLRDLQSYLPPGRSYGHLHCRRAPGSAVQTAIMTRLPVVEEHYHRLCLPGGSPQRYIQEVHLQRGDVRLVLFNNHWKSRRGGAEVTRIYRRGAEALTAHRLDRLEERWGPSGESWKWLAAGDFNQGPESFSFLAPQNLWAREKGTGGTYWYKEDWERIDHIFTGPGWSVSGFGPAAGPWADASGLPRPWRLYREEGWSDHLPLRVVAAF